MKSHQGPVLCSPISCVSFSGTLIRRRLTLWISPVPLHHPSILCISLLCSILKILRFIFQLTLLSYVCLFCCLSFPLMFVISADFVMFGIGTIFVFCLFLVASCCLLIFCCILYKYVINNCSLSVLTPACLKSLKVQR